jgi:hypothetical protein
MRISSQSVSFYRGLLAYPKILSKELNIYLVMTSLFRRLDLRWRVIILKQTGIKAKRIAEHLFVGETFERKILKLYEDTGGVTDIFRDEKASHEKLHVIL